MSWISSSIGKLIALLTDNPGAADSVQQSLTHTVVGGSKSLGNAGGTFNSQSEFIAANFNRRGIKQTRPSNMICHAVGDSAVLYGYNHGRSGVSAASDEGAVAITAQMDEDPTWFHGTVASTTGTGDTAPVLAYVSGANYTIDGGYLLNITKGTLSGTLTGASTVLSLTINSGSVATFLNSLPTTGSSLPVSTAIGIATAAITPAATTRDTPVAVTVTVNLAQIGGIYHLFTNGSVVDVGGHEYPEQSIVSGASGLLAGNQQTITLHVCNPNSQAIIFQGGIQGNAISADANDQRSAYFAFGSLTGTDMIYGNQVAGGVTGNILPNLGCEKWTATGGNSAWHLYPRAEVVKNTDSGFACVLEQNGVAWANTDVVECAPFPTAGGATAFFVRNQYTPSNSSFGMQGLFVLMNGPGISGGNTYAIRVQNQQTPATYSGAGGPLVPPWGIELLGSYGTLIHADTGPNSSFDSIVHVQSKITDVTSVIQLNWNAGGNLTFTDSTSRWAVSGAFDAQSGFLSNHVAGIASHTAPLAKITPGGTDGSITISGGIITAVVDPT